MVNFGFGIILLATIFPPIGQSAELPEGVWSGRYTDHTGVPYKIKYTITSQPDEGQKVYTIRMAFLGTDPLEEEELKKFSLNNDELSFIMGEGNDIETCHLTKKEGKEQYTGHCQSSLHREGMELSTISMKPPKIEMLD